MVTTEDFVKALEKPTYSVTHHKESQVMVNEELETTETLLEQKQWIQNALLTIMREFPFIAPDAMQVIFEMRRDIRHLPNQEEIDRIINMVVNHDDWLSGEETPALIDTLATIISDSPVYSHRL